MEQTADLPSNPSSSHGQAGTTRELMDLREDLGTPDNILRIIKEVEAESLVMRRKIHRLPASMIRVGNEFVTPMAVAIGPYHHGLPRLQGMEKAKRLAAYVFTRDSGHTYEEMYGRVLAVADYARHLYTEEEVSGISSVEFAAMMFHDACFLLQYMQLFSREGEMLSPSPLQSIFLSNQASIDNDIMLLENQIPWLVIEALVTTTEIHAYVDEFIVAMGKTMQITGNEYFLASSSFDYNSILPSDRPPHLLGLLRLHKQGVPVSKPPGDGLSVIQYSVPIRAKELVGNGIKLERSKTDKFNDMGIRNGLLFDKLFLPPLKLDHTMVSWLANMVAFEICTALPSAQNIDDTSVCSYLAVLAMLMHEEEDVHKLRAEGFVQGELSDWQILQTINGLSQKMTPSLGYFEILAKFQACKRRRWFRIMVYKFVSDNAKAIAAVLSIIGVLAGIFKALYSVKQH